VKCPSQHMYSIVSSSIIGAWNILGVFWIGQTDLRSGGKCTVYVSIQKAHSLRLRHSHGF
jgi:hypothetical protein